MRSRLGVVGNGVNAPVNISRIGSDVGADESEVSEVRER